MSMRALRATQHSARPQPPLLFSVPSSAPARHRRSLSSVAPVPPVAYPTGGPELALTRLLRSWGNVPIAEVAARLSRPPYCLHVKHTRMTATGSAAGVNTGSSKLIWKGGAPLPAAAEAATATAAETELVDELVLFKYDQIKTEFGLESEGKAGRAAIEARGIILRYPTWEVRPHTHTLPCRPRGCPEPSPSPA